LIVQRHLAASPSPPSAASALNDDMPKMPLRIFYLFLNHLSSGDKIKIMTKTDSF